VAFGGPNSISRVELSFDGGTTWQLAEIEPPLSNKSWVIWNYRWKPPKPGKYVVVVRATDTTGQLQIADIVRPQPAGASRPHTIVSEIQEV